MNKYGTVYYPVTANVAVASSTGTIQVIGQDQRWDVDEIDIVIGVLTNGYVRIGYGAQANNPMIQEWNGATSGESIRIKNVGVDNINQGAINIYYACDALTLRGQIGAHQVKQDIKVMIEATPSAAFPIRQGHKAISFNGNMLVLGGKNGGTVYNDVWSSPDGINWTQISVTPFTARWGHTVVNLNGTLYVIGGFSSSNTATPLSDVWSSTDGITWTNIQPNLGEAVGGHNCVVFNNQIFLYAGFGTTYNNNVWSSPDGINWTEIQSDAPWTGRYLAAGHVWNNKIWIMGGNEGGVSGNDVWSSYDGINWVESFVQTPFTVRDSFESHILLPFLKLYIFGGLNETGPVYYGDLWSTLDGTLWTQENATTAIGNREFYASVLFNGSFWIIGGYNGSANLNDVWRTNVPTM